MIFLNRENAGRRLAKRLSRFRAENPLIIALPRGGVAVALEVARALRSPLDILIVRKIGHPKYPEFGIGAVSEDLLTWLNGESDFNAADLDPIIKREQGEIRRRLQVYRGDRQAIAILGRTVLLIDDGLATGVTAIAAARLLRKRGARSIILAVPVCASHTAETLGEFVDEVVCLERVDNFESVGQYYRDFHQVSDKEVMAALREARTLGS